MNITDIISIETVLIGLDVKSKTELMDKMIELISNSNRITNIVEAKNEILKREGIMSTGIGKGLALPHAKTKAVTESVGAFAVLKSPVDFNSLDSKPVDLVFMLLGAEDSVANHLRLLSKISRLLNNESFRDNIKKSKSSEDLIEAFNKESDNY